MSADIVLGAGAVVLEAALLSVLAYRKMWRTTPLFFSLVAWWLLSDLLQVWMQRYPSTRVARFYALNTLADAAVRCMVLAELTWSLLRSYRKSLAAATVYLVGMTLVMGVLLCWPLASTANPVEYPRIAGFALQLNVSVSIVTVVCTTSLLVFARNMKVEWARAERQVAWGLLVFYVISILGAYSASILRRGANFSFEFVAHRIDLGVAVCFLVMLVYWIFSFRIGAKAEVRR